MVDYYKDNKRIVAKTYKYGIYLEPKDMLTETELADKGVTGILDLDTKAGYISTTDWGNLFKALYYCTNNDSKIICYCSRTDLVSLTANAINYALEDSQTGANKPDEFKNIMHNFDQLQMLAKIAYQVNKLATRNSDIKANKILDPINDQMCEFIVSLLYYPEIAHKVFTKLVELDVIANYE